MILWVMVNTGSSNDLVWSGWHAIIWTNADLLSMRPLGSYLCEIWTIPDTKVHGANMRPTWVLPAPDGPHVGPMNLVIRDDISFFIKKMHLNMSCVICQPFCLGINVLNLHVVAPCIYWTPTWSSLWLQISWHIGRQDTLRVARYPARLLHWHQTNPVISLVPAWQPWRVWVNHYSEITWATWCLKSLANWLFVHLFV